MAVDVELANTAETATVVETLHEAQEELWAPEQPAFVEEVVLDKGPDKGPDEGYAKVDLVREITEEFEAKTYVPERKRSRRRKWKKGQEQARRAVRNNRRRVKRAKGRALQRRRGEIVERSFAHVCDTGGLRRMTLRGQEKARKRYVLHAAAYNLGLLMRRIYGMGTPRGLAGRLAALISALWMALTRRTPTPGALHRSRAWRQARRRRVDASADRIVRGRSKAPSSTDCQVDRCRQYAGRRRPWATATTWTAVPTHR